METANKNPFCFRLSYIFQNETVVSDTFCYPTLDQQDDDIREQFELLNDLKLNGAATSIRLNSKVHRIIRTDELLQLKVLQQPIIPEEMPINVTLTDTESQRGE